VTEEAGPAAGRMLVARAGNHAAYVLTVAPLGTRLAAEERPSAMIVVTDPERLTPSADDLAGLYGLSPAESRLVAGLLRGMTLHDIAVVSGVQVSTLRTQLSSILRKVGVRRQADLIRVLASVRSVVPPASDVS
jgi:DNA-binding NarL/FixJ family response regulator